MSIGPISRPGRITSGKPVAFAVSVEALEALRTPASESHGMSRVLGNDMLARLLGITLFTMRVSICPVAVPRLVGSLLVSLSYR